MIYNEARRFSLAFALAVTAWSSSLPVFACYYAADNGDCVLCLSCQLNNLQGGSFPSQSACETYVDKDLGKLSVAASSLLASSRVVYQDGNCYVQANEDCTASEVFNLKVACNSTQVATANSIIFMAPSPTIPTASAPPPAPSMATILPHLTPSPPPAKNTAVIAGSTVGGVVALLLIGGLLLVWSGRWRPIKRKQDALQPAMSGLSSEQRSSDLSAPPDPYPAKLGPPPNPFAREPNHLHRTLSDLPNTPNTMATFQTVGSGATFPSATGELLQDNASSCTLGKSSFPRSNSSLSPVESLTGGSAQGSGKASVRQFLSLHPAVAAKGPALARSKSVGSAGSGSERNLFGFGRRANDKDGDDEHVPTATWQPAAGLPEAIANPQLPVPQHLGKLEAESLLDAMWQVDSKQLSSCKDKSGKNIVLGKGGYGRVYKGMLDAQEVAVKVVLSPTDHMRERFIREIQILRACHNPHIVQFIGANINHATTFLVMEFMAEGDLSSKLRSNRGHEYSWYQRGQHIALSVAKGLVYLHNRRIAHLDIKSANILLNRALEAKIADVGLGKLIPGADTTSMDVGTEGWCAPEQMHGSRCSLAADIYSFGVLLWEICTSEQPKMLQMREINVPEEAPQYIADLVAHCCTYNAELRPTAEAVHNVILQAVQGG